MSNLVFRFSSAVDIGGDVLSMFIFPVHPVHIQVVIADQELV
jgi:hypothetical protein